MSSSEDLSTVMANESLSTTTAIIQRAVDYLHTGPTRVVGLIMTNCVIATSFSGAVIEAVAIVFFINQFYRKNKYVASAYFYIAFAGYCVDFTAISLFVITFWLPDFYMLKLISDVNQWYVGFYNGPWNVSLSLNRFTAIVLFQRHPRVWSNRNTLFIVILLFLGPFIISGYSLADPYCRSHVYDSGCEAYLSKSRIIEISTNLVSCCISAVLTLISIYFLKPTVTSTWTSSARNASFERRLFIQCAVSTALFIFYNMFLLSYNFFRPHRTESAMLGFVYVVSVNLTNLAYNIYHYLNIILLIFVR
uniref:G_PROTEIN_RECEP_F1_2 domain-containing protein n=1 Tax=Panagrellus redivivus TaxID=6233 RepID=A0A7E4VD34_PANRE